MAKMLGNAGFCTESKWGRMLPEKLTIPQLVIKFPIFYGT
jgi:hypothetical protein